MSTHAAAVLFWVVTAGACPLALAAQPPPTGSGAPATIPASLDLAAWLGAHPTLAGALRWEAPTGAVLAYADWPAEMRARLAALVARIGRGEAPGLAEAPPLVQPVDPATPFPPLNPELARWPAEIARETYLAYAAQSLAVEIGAWVPWSMAGDDPATLAWLLDSRTLWRADPQTKTYRIPYDFGATTPGDPFREFQFLRANDLIGATARQTIERLIGWIGRNVTHFQGDWDAANVYANWQYYGWPPLERILAGTVQQTTPAQGVRHISGACFGTVGVLRLLLRTVNIPVELVHPCPGHGVPHFVREDLYLSHGDDPYDAMLQTAPPIPAEALLISRQQFDQWLGGDEVSITLCKNIGRQVRELALEQLPDALLAARCADRAAGTAPERSQVYAVFKFNYSVSQLEQRTLWQRLDQKIERLGGCAKLPWSRPAPG